MRLGTEDARLFYHAGMLALEQGDKTGARQYLTRALEINPYFSPLYAPQAQATLDTLD
jgi:Tfp pilus assembly protein PilF